MPPLFSSPLLVPPGDEPIALATFRAVALARFAPRDELLSLLGPEGPTPPLLDAWVAAGFLHLGETHLDPLESRTTAFLAVTAKGAQAFRMTTGRTLLAISRSCLRRGVQTRAHEAYKASFVLAMLAAERAGLLQLLGVEAQDKRLATATVVVGPTGPARYGLQADILLGYQGPQNPAALLVEVDRGTVSIRRMTDKFRAYVAWHELGGPERDFHCRALRVLTIVPDVRRLELLHAAALQATEGRKSRFFLFALQSSFNAKTPEMLFEPIARELDPDAIRHVPLFPSHPNLSLPPQAAPPHAPCGLGPHPASSACGARWGDRAATGARQRFAEGFFPVLKQILLSLYAPIHPIHAAALPA